MTKYILLFLTFTIGSLNSYGQEDKTPMQTVARIFNQYVEQGATTDSKTNKEKMTLALTELQKTSTRTNLPMLINVWMYYDPTDFPTRKLMEPLFTKDKSAALGAIKNRLKNKKSSEDRSKAPYSDLLAFHERLSE